MINMDYFETIFKRKYFRLNILLINLRKKKISPYELDQLHNPRFKFCQKLLKKSIKIDCHLEQFMVYHLKDILIEALFPKDGLDPLEKGEHLLKYAKYNVHFNN